MDDAERMSLCNRVARLEHEVDSVGDGQRTPPRRDLFEVLSSQTLHHHVGSSRVERSHVHDSGDVFALNLDRCAGLSDETGDRLWLLKSVVGQKLEGDPLVEVLMHGRHDDAHATPAQNLQHAVLAGDELTYLYFTFH
jgi:hypothetical protein